MALANANPISEADDLAFEDAAEIKHEYAPDQVIAMTGASWAHNRICVNTSASLNVQ